MKRLSRPALVMAAAVCATLLLVQFSVAAAPPEPFQDIEWGNTLPGNHISIGASSGAEEPDIAVYPNGTQLVAVYSHFVVGGGLPEQFDRDPYFSIYNVATNSWSAPQAVAANVGFDSQRTAVAVTTDDIAHVTWQEQEVGNRVSSALYYSNNGSGSFGAPQVRSALVGVMDSPSISTNGANVIDIVWAEGLGSPNVRHIRSTNGGATWPIQGLVADTPPSSLAPAIATDSSSFVHIVWTEELIGQDNFIWYVQGAENGSTMTWTPPIAISVPSPNPSTLRIRSQVPQVAHDGTTVHVSYTHIEDNPAIPDDERQYIYYTSCSTNCSIAANWSTPIDSMGAPYGDVNSAAPFFMSADISLDGTCPYVFFESVDPTAATGSQAAENEVVQGVNGCANFSSGGRLLAVDDISVRAVRPSVIVRNSNVHIVYERINGNSPAQIYHRFGVIENVLFIPAIFRN